MADDIETKLSAARTRLILEKPFLGALALRLPMTPGDPKWCKTTATDARGFYYNEDYIRALTLDETQFVLAHEALHCALSHFARRQHRVKHRWDVACDLAINPLLVQDGLKPPPNAVFLAEFEGMTEEEIYPVLGDDEDTEPMDQHLYDEDRREQGREPNRDRNQDREKNPNDTPQQPKDNEGKGGRGKQGQTDPNQGGAPQPPPLSATERDALAVQWQQRMAGAAQQAMQAGKLGGAMARLVDHLLQPQLPWRMLLARYMTALARDDYSYTRPSKREGTAILPSLRSQQLEIAAVVDTSGSISAEEMQSFVSEIDAIKGQLRARITLIACDAQVAPGAPWVFEPWEELKLPKEMAGGGGTSFVPAFAWIDRQDRQPDLVLYFTDGDGAFPAREPAYPVVWLIKGKAKVPWGQRVQLN